MLSHLSKSFHSIPVPLPPKSSFHTLSMATSVYNFPNPTSNVANGKKLANDLKLQLGHFINLHAGQVKQRPGIAFLTINDRSDIKMYMHQNIKTWKNMQFNFFEYHFSTPTNDLPIIEKIQELNDRDDIHGIMIYLPLPQNLIHCTTKIVNEIKLCKDVEGITQENMSKISYGDTKNAIIPCTAAACLHILKSHNIDLAGKHCVIINSSLNIGVPLFQLLLKQNATVTICNPYECNVRDMISEADIVISAIGKPGCIKSEWLKDNAVIVDVGICKQGKKTFGDFAIEEGKERFELVTPVPGGVGPLTGAMLAKNLVGAWAKAHNIPFQLLSS